MSWTEKRDRYQSLARTIDPSVIITTKDHWFWSALAWALCIITLGLGMRPRRFLEDFATTIGPVQAYPRQWKNLREAIIVHESQHTRQARLFGLGIHPWVGLLPMAVTYLLLPIPVLLSYFRYRLELDADRASWTHLLRTGQADGQQIYRRAERFSHTVSSGAYGWAWPKGWARKGFREQAQKTITRHEGRV